MIPAPSAKEMFEWCCLAWLGLVALGLVLVIASSWWVNRKKHSRRSCDHGHVIDIVGEDLACLRCGKRFPG